MIFNVLNFAMTIFALFFLERMSRARWSEKYSDARETEETTQMDREVAAEWFDFMMVDPDF